MGQRTRLEVTWSEFEPYLSQLRQALDCNQMEAFQAIGYANGMSSTWQTKNAVPIIALNAIRWVLHENGAAAPAPKARIRFTDGELEDIFLALRGRTLPDDARKTLVRKLAAELIER